MSFSSINKIKYLFIISLLFSLFSCDFIKSIFLPPQKEEPQEKPKDAINISLIDSNGKNVVQGVSLNTVKILSVNTDKYYSLNDITWNVSGPATLYTGQKDAILTITGAGQGKVSCSITFPEDNIKGYGEYLFSSDASVPASNGGSTITVSSGTINTITPDTSNVFLDIGQLKNILINNNLNAKNIHYFGISSNENVAHVYSGYDYVGIKGLSAGTSMLTIYNDSKSVSCTITVTVSNNIFVDNTVSNITCNFDTVTLDVGKQTIVTTNRNVTSYSENENIFSIIYSDGIKHVIRANNVGISSLIFSDPNNNSSYSIPIIVTQNGTISSSVDPFSVSNTYFTIAKNEKLFIPISNCNNINDLTFAYENYYINLYKSSNGIIIEGKESGNTTLTISNFSKSIDIIIFVKDELYTPQTPPSNISFSSPDTLSLTVNKTYYVKYSSNISIIPYIDSAIAHIVTYTDDVFVISADSKGSGAKLIIYSYDMKYKLKEILIDVSDNGTYQGVVNDPPVTNFKTLSISPVNSSLRVGEVTYFNVINNIANAYIWGVSNPDIAEVVISNNSYAKIKGKAVGETYITCSTSDGNFVSSTILSVVPISTEYTVNDYIGINVNTNVSLNVGDTLNIPVTTIPSEINGQIEMKYVIDDPTILSITSYNNMSFNIKALKAGITTILVSDIGNKYKKYINVVIKEIGDSTSPSFISVNQDYFLVDLGEQFKISASIVPTPNGVYKPENSNTWSVSDSSGIEMYANNGSATCYARKSGEYTISIRNPYANNSPFAVKVYVRPNNMYIGFKDSKVFGVVGRTMNVSCDVSNVPSGVQLTNNDFVWDIVDANGNVQSNPCATIVSHNLNTVSLNYLFAYSGNNQYLRVRVGALSAKIPLYVEDQNILSIGTSSVNIEPVSEYVIPITEISPTSATPLVLVSDTNNAFTYSFVKDSNQVVTGIKITPSNLKETENASITVLHPINRKIQYKINITIKWESYFTFDLNNAVVNSNAIYDPSKWTVNNTYNDNTSTRPVIIKYRLSKPTSDNVINITYNNNADLYYNVYNYGFNQDTRTGYFIISSKQYDSTTRTITFKPTYNNPITITLRQALSGDIHWEALIQSQSHNFGVTVSSVYDYSSRDTFKKIWNNAFGSDTITFNIRLYPYIYNGSGNKQYINPSTINSININNYDIAYDPYGNHHNTKSHISSKSITTNIGNTFINVIWSLNVKYSMDDDVFGSYNDICRFYFLWKNKLNVSWNNNNNNIYYYFHAENTLQFSGSTLFLQSKWDSNGTRPSEPLPY